MSGAKHHDAGRFWPIIASGRCIGHIIHRGPAGLEAFNQVDTSIGVFPSLPEAADALQRQESGQ
jgi:hypothetical protein